MPTPHGSRGGMAFSADELRVVRRALAQALHPTTTLVATAPAGALREGAPPPGPDPGWAEDVQEYVRLAESLDEAVREGGRLRAFLLADLRRYRDALPGAAPGYLERLADAVDTGYLPTPEDLTALRSLRALHCPPAERERRTELLRRCRELAEHEVRARLSGARRPAPVPAAPLLRGTLGRSRAVDVLIPAGTSGDGPERPQEPSGKPEQEQPRAKPAPPRPQAPKPGEPKPGEPKPAEPAKPQEEKPAEHKEPKPGEPKPGEPQTGEPRKPEPAKPEPGKAEPGKPRPKEPEQPRRRTPTPAEIWPPRRRGRPSRPTQPGQPGQPKQPPRPSRPENPDSGRRVERLELATG
jgi:hypothetical protein